MLERYKTNPFLADMVVPVSDKTIKLSNMFGKENNVLLDQSTGEILATHVTTYKRVDSEQFVKLFAHNVGLIFNLKSSGTKAFTVLIWAVQNKAISKDTVDLELLTLNDFKEAHPELAISIATFQRGLAELCKAQIIAKHLKMGRYFINPNFVFNGDRIAFTTLIERTNND
jgi:hypothetical protein